MSFDKLLNSNCSWSYKTMKTVTLEARRGNNPVFKLQNTNITERCEDQERSGSLQSATNDGDVIESEKGVFIDSPEKNEALTRLDCIPDSPYDCIHPDENELKFSADKKIKIIHKSKTNTKNTRRKSYVRSGVTNVDSTGSPIKPLTKNGRNAAAKSVEKSVKRRARAKKPSKNTECIISTRSDVVTRNAKVKKRLNNTEHKINSESDIDSVDVPNSSITIFSKDANRKSFAGSDAKSIDKPDARNENTLLNPDRNNYAESDASNIDTSNARIEEASKDAEHKSYAESDLESFDLSDSSLVLSLKKIFGKSSAEPDAKNISDAREEIALKNAERKSCTGSDLESVNKVESSIKNSLRNSDRKSYAKYKIETDADSSSDEETVLQTRICNEEGKAISNVPVDKSNHASEHIESVLNDYDNLNNISFDNSDHSDLKNELNEAFDKSLENPESSVIPVDGKNSIVKPQALNCQEIDRLEKSFSKKRNPKRKFAAEHSSFELSSLSEAGDADDEIDNGVYSNSFNEMKVHNKRKTDSEVIQKCLNISSEVHSMCETMESRETSELDEIVHDFFNGTFDVSKYKKNKISPTVSQERYETTQNGEKTKILARDKETNLSASQTPDSFIINTDSDCGEASESPVKSVRRKSLKTKQTPGNDLKNMKTRTPTKLPKNSFNDKPKSKELSANKSKTNQSLNTKLSSKIRSEETLVHKYQDLEKSFKNDGYGEEEKFTVSYSPERPFFAKYIEMPKTENLLKRKSTNGNVIQGSHSRVKPPSNEVSKSTDTNYKNRETYKQQIHSEKPKLHEIVKTSTAKRPKTWDDLENLYSEEAVWETNLLLRCQDEPILLQKKSAIIDELEDAENKSQYNKRARLQTHKEKEYRAFSSTPQNRSGTENQIATMTPKNTLKPNDELALVSPNANIIDKIMKNMEKCTQPYLSSSKKKLKTFLSDFEQTSDNNKSPMVAEYSYSIKEIQSTIRVTSGNTRKIRNVVHREVEQQRSLPNKNGQVQKQETASKSMSMSKDNCEGNSFNKMNFDTPRRKPNKFLNKEGSIVNSKPNVLKNILARLDVGEYTHDNGRDSSCADGKQTHFLTHKNKGTPDFGSSISTINTFSVEQGHYNLRKRKSKNYFDELESDENDGNVAADRVTNHKRSNTKLRMDWNDGNTDGTDSSCEIIDILEMKQGERKIDKNRKSFEVEKSKALSTKPENSYKTLNKKKAVIRESSLLPKSSMLLNNSEESDSEGTIYELNDIKIQEINNKSHRNAKRHLLSKEDILENSSSESDWDIFDYPERNRPQAKVKQNKSQLKVADNRNSKSNVKINAKSNEKNCTNTEKNQRSFTSHQNSPKNNDSANFDGKKKLVRSVEKNINTSKNTKEFPSTKINQNSSIKSPSKKTQDVLFVKKQNPQFARELEKSDPNLKVTTPSQKVSEKNNSHDSYKKYLETIFKSSSKNSTNRDTSSRNLAQKLNENTLSAESNEDKFFSLSSSDSDDSESSTTERMLKIGLGLGGCGGLGLCGDILSEENGEE